MTTKLMLLLTGLGGAALASAAFLVAGHEVSADSEVAVARPSQTGAVASRRARSDEESDRSWLNRFRGPKLVEVTIPAGTPITVALDIAIDSSEMRAGDEIGAKLVNALSADGHVVAKAGSAVTGRVVERDESGRVKGREHLTLRLEQLDTVNGRVGIETASITLTARDNKKRDAAVIGGTAAAGAIIGAITGGGDGAAKGAAVGGIGGTGIVLATPGEDIELSPGHELTFSLHAPITAKLEVKRD